MITITEAAAAKIRKLTPPEMRENTPCVCVSWVGMITTILMSCFLTGCAVGGEREPELPAPKKEDNDQSLEARPEAGLPL